MSDACWIASSKEIVLPDEIEDYNNARIFDVPNKSFSIWPVDADYAWEVEQLKRLFTMPCIYNVGGLGHEYFWLYVWKYTETEGVIEIINIYIRHKTDRYIDKMLAEPEPIYINIGSLTYENRFGTYNLNPKHWLEDLQHRELVTIRGMTTIVKY